MKFIGLFSFLVLSWLLEVAANSTAQPHTAETYYDVSSAIPVNPSEITTTRNDKIIEYFQQCPVFSERLNDTCHSIKASCEYRCGEFLNWLNFNISGCSCDVFCQLFGDCCWDFQTQCPDMALQYTQRYSHVKIANLTCENDSPIIEECENNSDETNQNIDDLVAPIVSYKDFGIHFRNKQVLLSCFYTQTSHNDSLSGQTDSNSGNRSYNLSDDAWPWLKKITSLNPISILDIERLMNSGESFHRTEFNVQNIHPNISTKRLCARPVVMKCFRPGDNIQCKHPQYIKFDNITRICGVYSNKPTEGFSSVPAVYSTPIPQNDIVIPSYDIGKDTWTQGDKGCRLIIRYIYHDVFTRFGFSCIANFMDRSYRRFEITSSAGYDWLKISCMKDNPEGGCSLRVLCDPRYIHFDNGCHAPNEIITHTVGKDLVYLFKFLDAIFANVMETFKNSITVSGDNSLFADDIRLASKENLYQVRSHVSVDFFNVNHDGPDLPITRTVSDYMRNAGVDFSKVFQVTICIRLKQNGNFVFGTTPIDGAVMLCDRVFSFPKNFTVHHFKSDSTADVPIDMSLMNEFLVNRGMPLFGVFRDGTVDVCVMIVLVYNVFREF